MVEVVHVRRGKAGLAVAPPQTALRDARAETWLEGFRARPAQPILLPTVEQAAPEAPPPVGHFMPMWQPSQQQVAPLVEEPSEMPVKAATPRTRRPRCAKAGIPTLAARHFADPFAADEDGTNCIRCGYLVEPVREKRGLATCLACG